ncbi:MAG: hypothetical protein MJE77_31045 [Proteobacteria bacterium]|nr:hypothetical protein [Pseudomonadota bacterium]
MATANSARDGRVARTGAHTIDVATARQAAVKRSPTTRTVTPAGQIARPRAALDRSGTGIRAAIDSAMLRTTAVEQLAIARAARGAVDVTRPFATLDNATARMLATDHLTARGSSAIDHTGAISRLIAFHPARSSSGASGHI